MFRCGEVGRQKFKFALERGVVFNVSNMRGGFVANLWENGSIFLHPTRSSVESMNDSAGTPVHTLGYEL